MIDGEIARSCAIIADDGDGRRYPDDGTRQRFTGTHVLRRVNDVDGASASQLRWRLGAADLRRTPTV